MLILRKEPTNEKDRLAVCVQKEGQVVGHVPRNLAPLLFYRDVNKGFAEVTAVPLNRGAGMGSALRIQTLIICEETEGRDLESVRLQES